MSLKSKSCIGTLCLGVCLMMAVTSQLGALVVPERTSPVVEKELLHPDLHIRNELMEPSRLPAQAAERARQDLAALGLAEDRGLVDVRGGRWGTLLTGEPLIPGRGRGNGLSWDDLGTTPPADAAAFERAAWNALTGYLERHQAQLRIDPAELTGRSRAERGGELVQIYGARTVDGITVRDSYVTAAISHGNLVLFGAHNWGDLHVPTRPQLTADDALGAAQAYLEPYTVEGYWGKPELVIVPMARGNDVSQIAVGQGYDYRLTYAVRPTFAADGGRWEALVDARSGEVLSFGDTNHYVASTRAVKGGVYPETNDGSGPEGTEQAGWPMPFADVSTAACGNGVCEITSGESCVTCAADCNGVQGGNPSNRFCCGNGGTNPVGCADSRCTSGGFQCSSSSAGLAFADGGGNLLSCVDGSATSTLNGRFMVMADQCGAISLTSNGDIDFGTSGGIDCTTPGFGGPGNTHASRSGFYELNRIKEMARGQLPGNGWLQEKLQANMNINNTCNAFWNGATVNFYRSGGGCNNTGEIAGVFDHEWGHGMDDNDVNPTISNPGEGIADVYASLRLNTSCIGRGFRLGTACGGYGDPCVGTPPCDGVRDIDWAQRASGTPHDVTWIDANCGSGSTTPCGGSTHCEGGVYAEAVWDLVHRDLSGDLNTNLEVGTRLTYLGAALVGNWFQCVQGSGGCPADSGYMSYLAADDDNGDLGDGTPHMTAIFNAFNRHGIACSTPARIDKACAPTTAPAVTGTASDRGASLSWGAVTGATSYEVFRTEGVFGCDFGKTKVGETTGTSFADSGLQNGRAYYYTVIPIGDADSCLGPASSCTTVTPTAGPNFAVGAGTLTLGTTGDNDAFLDNCETGTWSFDVTNIGTGTQGNVRIVAVTPSNPGVTIDTALPSAITASLAECGIAGGGFDFTAGGLTPNETLTFDVDITSDQLSPAVKTVTFSVSFAESDFQHAASKTYTFEGGTEGWAVVEGTFNRTNGTGAQGTSWFEASSDNLPDQCDHVRSPVIGLTSTSTLSVWNQFDIEGIFQGSTWYDRANVGIFSPLDGGRSPVDPDGGRLYNASGANGTCGTTGQNGWGGAATSWAASTWSSSALGASGVAGQPVQLDVRYGTDAVGQGFGLHFDEVTLTDFDELVADALTDNCAALPFCGNNLIESGETCDGSDLAGLSCADFGCSGGSLACQVDCLAFDTSACTSCGPVCGNGICEPGEDCLSCSNDCAGVTGGKPANRFCCGNGVLEGPEGDGSICDGNP